MLNISISASVIFLGKVIPIDIRYLVPDSKLILFHCEHDHNELSFDKDKKSTPFVFASIYVYRNVLGDFRESLVT